MADPPKPLPSELDAFLRGRGSASTEQSTAAGQGSAEGQGTLQTGQGAIYVSMGTVVRLTAAELQSLASSFSKLPNPILWKLPPTDLPSKHAASTIAGS